ncbi:cytochrome P450 [Planotetraspora mira]|uniref:Cytochrome P450 hydroxylase n=1 Tax=Planotetraspora mira TaxID=58121 RepID=A0A8J3TQ65_9ACTN|nr:cytochrome P450 [Planotetraspora mira]GII28559.1 cytochrome P450 hydroxylase [Planotetraspora mira]
MEDGTVFEQILDYSNRADPYPLFAELRKTPVERQPDGSYVVSTYREIVALLHDPRVSSDPRDTPEPTMVGPSPGEETPELPSAFIRLNPPDHDRLRSVAMRHFGPPDAPGRITGMAPRMTEIITGLIDGFAGRTQADIVNNFAYPLPVTVICELLGVPREDDRQFHRWSRTIIEANDQTTGPMDERRRRRVAATAELSRYLQGLVDVHRRNPGDDLLSDLATDEEMPPGDLLSTAALLLVAGHETTVNLISNGVLLLLRHPHLLERLRGEPGLAAGLVEELLRYDPPVQALGTGRNVLADIDIAGTTIPRGAVVTLVLAAGSRDPNRFDDPDHFDPERKDNQHLGFGGGIHYCFGAPLARLETQLALTALARRLVNPRLVADPPPYRQHPFLRGPRHLLVEFDGIAPG